VDLIIALINLEEQRKEENQIKMIVGHPVTRKATVQESKVVRDRKAAIRTLVRREK